MGVGKQTFPENPSIATKMISTGLIIDTLIVAEELVTLLAYVKNRRLPLFKFGIL